MIIRSMIDRGGSAGDRARGWRNGAGHGESILLIRGTCAILPPMYRESLLARHAPSREVGAHHGDERRRHAPVDRRAARLERLGARVPLEPVAATAAGVLF